MTEEDKENIYSIADAAIKYAVEELDSGETYNFLKDWYHGEYWDEFKKFALEEYGDE